MSEDRPRNDPAPEERPGEAAGPAGAVPTRPEDLPPDGAMSMLDHLEDLRRALIQSLIAALAATVICWFWSRPLLNFVVRPILSAAEGIYFHAPLEAFMTRLKLSAVMGLFLVLPYVLYKIYGFILPGLYRRERRVVTPLLVSSTGLFYGGVLFAFLLVIPQVVRIMLGFGTEAMQPLIGIGPYFAFVARLCLAFGLIFELPLVVLFLSLIGLVDPRLLLRGWRYAVLLIFVFSAVLTPPDVVSQMLMAAPVSLLYIVSVLVAIAVTRRRRSPPDGD